MSTKATQEAVQRPYRHCPNCGRWTELDDYGRIGIHDYSSGECPGSRESTDLTRSMSETLEQTAHPEPGVLAAAHCIVRALLPGNGRGNI
jgi:hypothetical protein